MAAEVWCQPIQMTFGDVNGIDMSACNAWRWRPDYEEIDLLFCRYSKWLHTLSTGSLALSSHYFSACRKQWRPLAAPRSCMGFDFCERQIDMQPSAVPLAIDITADGVCNAIAFWFDLQLDEHSQISSSPYKMKVRFITGSLKGRQLINCSIDLFSKCGRFN